MKYLLTSLLLILPLSGQNIVVNTTSRDQPLITSEHISNGRLKLTNLHRTDLSGNPLTIGTTPIDFELGGSITNHLDLASIPETFDITPGRSRKAVIIHTNGVPLIGNATYTFNIKDSTVYFIGADGEIPPGEVEPPTEKTVSLTWNANPEPDIAGYKLYYGLSTGTYTVTNDVGGVTSTSVPSLTLGTTYFFALTAYNTAALESTFSNEVSDSN